MTTAKTGRVADGVDRLPSGKYRARYRDPETGKQHSAAFDKLGDAKAWLRAQRVAVDRGDHVAPNDRTTVHDMARRWVLTRPYRQTTRRRARSFLAHLEASALGRMPIRRVKPADVQQFVHEQSQTLAPVTTRRLYTFVKGVFRFAVENGRIGRTPCVSTVRLPNVDTVPVVPLTVEQVRALAEAMPDRYRAGVILQAALGLRLSELLGLQVADVDFLRRRVQVERQLSRYPAGFVPLKTESSRRLLPLARDVAPLLAQHIAAFPPNSDGVILTTRYGNPVRQDKYGQVFTAAVKAAGLPAGITPHDLRHHYASVLLRERVPVNVVAKYLGHSTAALVLTTYGHLMPDSDDLVRDALDGLWSASVTPVSHKRLASV